MKKVIFWLHKHRVLLPTQKKFRKRQNIFEIYHYKAIFAHFLLQCLFYYYFANFCFETIRLHDNRKMEDI